MSVKLEPHCAIKAGDGGVIDFLNQLCGRFVFLSSRLQSSVLRHFLFFFRSFKYFAPLFPHPNGLRRHILRFTTSRLRTVGLDQINLSSQTARGQSPVPTTARVTYHVFCIACRDKAFGFNTQTCPLLNNTSFTFDDATVISTSSSSPSPPFTLLRLSSSHSSFAQ